MRAGKEPSPPITTRPSIPLRQDIGGFAPDGFLIKRFAAIRFEDRPAALDGVGDRIRGEQRDLPFEKPAITFWTP